MNQKHGVPADGIFCLGSIGSLEMYLLKRLFSPGAIPGMDHPYCNRMRPTLRCVLRRMFIQFLAGRSGDWIPLVGITPSKLLDWDVATRSARTLPTGTMFSATGDFYARIRLWMPDSDRANGSIRSRIAVNYFRVTATSVS